MLTAVSSGVRVAEIEADRAGKPGELLLGQTCRAQLREAVVVGAARAHRPNIRDLGPPQRRLQQGNVELRVMCEHRDHRATVDPSSFGLRRQVAVRPVHDDLVGVGEPGAGREYRPGVADAGALRPHEADPLAGARDDGNPGAHASPGRSRRTSSP